VVTGGIVPLVVLESWVGRRAQAAGTRGYLAAGFAILAAGAASFPLLGFSPELLLFMFAAVNIGAAFVEPLTDTRFFEIATPEEARRYFGIYHAAAPAASLVGPLLAAAVISLGLGLNGVWVHPRSGWIGSVRIPCCTWVQPGFLGRVQWPSSR
jgi:MFS family permease